MSGDSVVECVHRLREAVTLRPESGDGGAHALRLLEQGAPSVGRV
jgi:hypothetical protein